MACFNYYEFKKNENEYNLINKTTRQFSSLLQFSDIPQKSLIYFQKIFYKITENFRLKNDKENNRSFKCFVLKCEKSFNHSLTTFIEYRNLPLSLYDVDDLEKRINLIRYIKRYRKTYRNIFDCDVPGKFYLKYRKGETMVKWVVDEKNEKIWSLNDIISETKSLYLRFLELLENTNNMNPLKIE